MAKKKDKVTKDELITLCEARRRAIRRLENHLSNPGAGDIITYAMNNISSNLTNKIADKLEIFLEESKTERSMEMAEAPKIMAVFKNVHMDSSSIRLIAKDL